MMKDRFTVGFIAGTIAAIVSQFVNFLLVSIINLGNMRFVDFSGVMILGHIPDSLGEEIVAYIGYIVFSGLLAQIYMYFIKLVGHQNYWFKSIIFGIGSWFSIYSITILFAVEGLKEISMETAITNFIASITYGLVIGIVAYILEKKYDY
ncbi:hypothetical protein [Natronospora cellulosivora (SeqCode)]